ncbi:MAG: hypothetical protein HQL15_04075 [Candidatus Omnitrophica bacterium]|nr:hypothetical protein [Candidatus Omnitrophota bacterium]
MNAQPTVLVALLLCLVCFLYIISLIVKAWSIVKSNCETFAQYLKSEVGFRWDITFTVSGSYKGREIGLNVSPIGKSAAPFFWIRPRISLSKQPLLMLDYPKVTEETYLNGDRIYGRPSAFLGSSIFWTNLNIEDFISVLEELTRAAEIVESGKLSL